MLQRLLTLIFTAVETVLVGGTILGWSNMQNVFIKEGFFRDPENGNSTFQVESLNLVVTVSTTAGKLIAILFGCLIDAKGLWFGRTVALFLIALAYALFVLALEFSDYLLFVAGISLMTGNVGMWCSNLQMSNVFPGYQSFYGYLINGCGPTACSICSTASTYSTI